MVNITLESITKSHLATKKFNANLLVDGRKRTIPFGAKGMSDYTIHRDPQRKERYISRHQAREDWKNPLTAGFWSRWYLWNQPTLSGSETDLRKRFGL